MRESFIIYWAISLKQGFKREEGDSVKRNTKSLWGNRGPHENQLRVTTKFHGGEEIRGHRKTSVSLATKSINHQLFIPYVFVPITWTQIPNSFIFSLIIKTNVLAVRNHPQCNLSILVYNLYWYTISVYSVMTPFICSVLRYSMQLQTWDWHPCCLVACFFDLTVCHRSVLSCW